MILMYGTHFSILFLINTNFNYKLKFKKIKV